MSSDSDDATSDQDEAEMLPDERAVIAERASDLDKMDEDEFLSVDELREQLNLTQE
jgi:hypothetical protein